MFFYSVHCYKFKCRVIEIAFLKSFKIMVKPFKITISSVIGKWIFMSFYTGKHFIISNISLTNIWDPSRYYYYYYSRSEWTWESWQQRGETETGASNACSSEKTSFLGSRGSYLLTKDSVSIFCGQDT